MAHRLIYLWYNTSVKQNRFGLLKKEVQAFGVYAFAP